MEWLLGISVVFNVLLALLAGFIMVLKVGAENETLHAREVCKKGLLIALNCGDMVRASAALASSLSDASIKERIKKAKDKGTFPAVMRCKQILEKLVEHNGYLLNHIHSGIGHELTNIESQIMDIIIESILMEGEVLIPIHDSVIVVESFKDKAEEIMYNAYDVVVGGENSIVTCKVGEV